MSRFARIAAGIGLVLVAAIGGGVAWWKHAPRHTPEGQSPLRRLDAATLHELRSAFNAHAGEDRLVVMLSPT
jgi:hypothetical protein